jgi:hypothetical protein
VEAEARVRLRDVIARYGNEVLDSPPRLRGLLADVCPEFELEVRLLVQAAEEGIPGRLRTTEPVLIAGQVQREVAVLRTRRGLAPETATWAVGAFQWALGLGSPPSDLELPAGPRPAPPAPTSTASSPGPPRPLNPPAGRNSVVRLRELLRLAPGDAAEVRRALVAPGEYVKIAQPVLELSDRRDSGATARATILRSPHEGRVAGLVSRPGSIVVPNSELLEYVDVAAYLFRQERVAAEDSGLLLTFPLPQDAFAATGLPVALLDHHTRRFWWGAVVVLLAPPGEHTVEAGYVCGSRWLGHATARVRVAPRSLLSLTYTAPRPGATGVLTPTVEDASRPIA